MAPTPLLRIAAFRVLLMCVLWYAPLVRATIPPEEDGAPVVLPWGDQGDGTYRNPILPADFSDPDVIRVGEEFYMVASDFHFMGIQVLHSRDLVNWRFIGRVFERLDLDPKYDEMRGYAEGTWAPTLRYHNGRFHLYVCTPREGLYRWTAEDPSGPWAGPLVIREVEGWEDPCPFWDDDGNAYLVRGRVGAGPIILHRMNPEGTELLDDGVEIYRGPVAEGPKFLKRNGWYYLSLPEGGVTNGGQTLLRSRHIYGPYERRVVVPDGGPHQGALVDLENGESWFIGYKSTGHLGRVVHLNPVRWNDDGWPTFGENGIPVEGARKPDLPDLEPPHHPELSDGFESDSLAPQWQWNHNPVAEGWSMTERSGWLRLHGLPADSLAAARNSLTQKLWGASGAATVKVDVSALADGQRAGIALMSGRRFDPIGVVAEGTQKRLFHGDTMGRNLPPDMTELWLRVEWDGDRGHLLYSFDGVTFADSGSEATLAFGQWKGARVALFCFGEGDGQADFDDFRFEHGLKPVSLGLPAHAPIDREALVKRHSPVIRSVDHNAPLTVGNGGFAFTVDITGLQTFGDAYHANGIPLETLARWCWVTEENPHGYTLEDANQEYRQADGSVIQLPTDMESEAGQWLRRNPRLHPLGQFALEWDKPDGSAFTPDDIEDPRQTLDLWRGVITSRYKLGGVPVTVTTAADPGNDAIAIRIESELVKNGQLRVRLAFPRGHDTSMKNTPPLDWSQPESHASELLNPQRVVRRIHDRHYYLSTTHALRPEQPHHFLIEGGENGVLEFGARFSSGEVSETPSAHSVRERSSEHWRTFWQSGAAADFSGSTHPLAEKLERRMVLSQYLTAVQSVSEIPPQESGLTCNTWYGKHHTEMIWWHIAHFILWGRTPLAEKNLQWYLDQLPMARRLAASRGLEGARWPKMVGPEGRESPGGNPLIVWNQPHPIHLADLIARQSPAAGNFEKYRDLVLETAAGIASMLHFDAARATYVLGPPLWIAQEIHDPATSQNPSFELAYWRWGLEVAQKWRVRLGMERDPGWDHIIANLPPLPVADGKYVALESHPDTWSDIASRHDHPEMLMSLGFLPETDYVDREIMHRTLTGVLEEWDWQTKIWGWDYPMVAMTATRLGRPDEALEILLRDGPNNIYTASGHCPQGSDRIQDSQTEGRREIAVYLPANGAFLATLALMLAGWEGSRPHPGFPDDGTWSIRTEGIQKLP